MHPASLYYQSSNNLAIIYGINITRRDHFPTVIRWSDSNLRSANQELTEIRQVRQAVYNKIHYEANGDISMDVNQEETTSAQGAPMVFATRAKPVKNNKFAKRVGAKTTKKLELAKNAAFTLSSGDAMIYRALAARCN